MSTDLKRISSVKQKIKNYQQQKLAIKTALSNVDLKSKKKVFADGEETSNTVSSNKQNNKQKKSLFESDDDDAEDNFNISENTSFEVKDPKLFELQTKFKSDKRFKIDERFVDDSEEAAEVINDDSEDISLEMEKKKEMDILSQVLGTSVRPKDAKLQEKFGSVGKKGMLRFDPTQQDHLKYEVKHPAQANDAGKKSKIKRKEKAENDEETEKPIVSKDVFYKVEDGLKNALQGPQDFSLLNLFGHKGDDKPLENEAEATAIDHKNNSHFDNNPFRYDSSDDEAEIKTEPAEEAHSNKDIVSSDGTFWAEPFFFKANDSRLKEGAEFITKIGNEKKGEFLEQRKSLKHLIKVKAKNIEKQNNPFKKKLGGNKAKQLKLKRALKR